MMLRLFDSIKTNRLKMLYKVLYFILRYIIFILSLRIVLIISKNFLLLIIKVCETRFCHSLILFSMIQITKQTDLVCYLADLSLKYNVKYYKL